MHGSATERLYTGATRRVVKMDQRAGVAQPLPGAQGGGIGSESQFVNSVWRKCHNWRDRRRQAAGSAHPALASRA